MNIKELAEQAGIKSPDLWKLTIGPTAIFQLEKFAELVENAARKDEREECAKVCDNWERDEAFVDNIADAIRARSKA